LKGVKSSSLEAAVLRDADWLMLLEARGMVRAFAAAYNAPDGFRRR